jgi:hypothetical protein
MYVLIMNRTSKKLTYLVCILAAMLAFDQVGAQQKIGLESLIPPAPNAAELGKYGTYPVGELTGIPDISFPLYEIHSGSLRLPISLSYHAGGIRVNEKSTDVGLGWSVSAGGQISRTVYGAIDEGPYGYFNYTPPSYSTLSAISNYYTMATYDIVGNAGYDLEPDLFSYNIGGKSGKFHADVNHNFVTVPFEPIKIEKNNDAGGKLGFRLTGDDGVIYIFNNYGTSYTEGTNAGSPIGARTTASTWYLTYMVSPDLVDTISFTYDRQVIHDVMEQYVYPIGMDNNGLVFGASSSVDGYVAGAQKIESQITYIEWLVDRVSFKNGYIQFNRNTQRSDSDDQLYSLDEMQLYNSNNQLLKRFAFNHDYFLASSYINDANHHRLKLTGFAEEDSTGALKKTYGFDYNSTALPPYNSTNIDYWGFANGSSNQTLIPQTTIQQATIASTTIGGQTYSNSGISTSSSATWTFGDANREPSATDMNAAILSKVTYPTGGYSTFDFEPHQYSSNSYITQNISRSGSATGISKLTKSTSSYSFTYPSSASYSSVNASFITANLTIKFSVSSMIYTELGPTQTVSLLDGSGNVIQSWTHTGNLTDSQTVTASVQLQAGNNYSIQTDVYGTSAVNASSVIGWTENTDQHPIKIGGGLRIKAIKDYNMESTLLKEENYTYGVSENGLGVRIFDEDNFYRNYEDIVLDYFIPYNPNGGSGSCTRKVTTWQRKFMGLSKYNSINYMGSPILYATVTKYEGNPSSNIGKTVSNFGIISDDNGFPAWFVNSGNYGTINNAWHQGELQDETVYKNTGTQYIPVSKSTYEYSTFNFRSDPGILFKQYKQFIQLNGAGSCYTDPTGPDPGNYMPGQGYFVMTPYVIKSGAYKKTKETKIMYDQLNPSLSLSTVTATQYQNAANLYPTQTSMVQSDTSVTKITRYTYPQDDASAVAAAMVTKNMLVMPIQVKMSQTKAGVEMPLSTMQTTYKQVGNLIVKDTIKASTRAVTPEPRVQFPKYDSYGNIAEQQKTGDVMRSYLYGYNGAYPIAEVVNADSASFAYTSFESSETGNWIVNGGSPYTLGSVTGANGYNLPSGTSVFKAGLSSSRAYKVGYWSKNGPASISGAAAVTGVSRNGWTYYQHLLPGGTTSVTLTGSGNIIDELRLLPVDAQMTTYAYQPLVGMMSMCDINNRVTYYEYDGLLRLKRILDQDHNIVKSIDYQYQANTGCGNTCFIMTMQTLAGTNTLGYPVGVFDVNGKLVGNAAGPSQYVTLWNSDTADHRVGTLAVGGDSLHFNMTLNSGQTLPSGVTGCRYYQFDLAWNNIDAIRNHNGAYVDFGDGIGMKLSSVYTVAAPVPANTTANMIYDGEELTTAPYYIHTYPDSSLKTITIYHNDDVLHDHFDNKDGPATSLTKMQHFRGNLPQNLYLFGGSCYQNASMNSIDSIYNWSSIHNVTYLNFNNGDGANPFKHMNYAQDFMQYNSRLETIQTARGYYQSGYRDTTFRLSRLKSDWNTYFTRLQFLAINDDHWNREDLSALHQLSYFLLYATTQNHQDDANSPLIPLPVSEIDAIFNQIANGAGRTVSNGYIFLFSGGSNRSATSDAAVRQLLSKGWVLYVNGSYLTNP